MKRYQCIKNVWAEPELIYPEEGRQLLFKQGNFYYEQSLDNYPELTDNKGNIHLISPELLENFKELPPIYDIPRDEADREPFTTPEPRRKLTAGWAWFIALVITIGFFILKAFTE